MPTRDINRLFEHRGSTHTYTTLRKRGGKNIHKTEWEAFSKSIAGPWHPGKTKWETLTVLWIRTYTIFTVSEELTLNARYTGLARISQSLIDPLSSDRGQLSARPRGDSSCRVSGFSDVRFSVCELSHMLIFSSMFDSLDDDLCSVSTSDSLRGQQIHPDPESRSQSTTIVGESKT